MEMQDFRFIRNFLAWHPSQATERQLPTAIAPYESSRRFLSFSKVEEGHLVYKTDLNINTRYSRKGHYTN